MIYTPNDIKWIKHITNTLGGTAYLELNNEFTLHVPTSSKSNALSPLIDEIIVLYQNIKNNSYFTHLVTPIDNILIDEFESSNYRPEYRYGRKVKVIAITTAQTSIPRARTNWQTVNFRGVSQGNICDISHISEINGIDELKAELWGSFSPFFLSANQVSISTNQSIIDELTFDANNISILEGRSKLVAHLIKERNKRIVAEKKNEAILRNSLKCEVCDFSFREKYGIDFMECHHIDPIGNGVIRETTKERLALVCPNCHRMLHRKFDNKFLSIEELKTKFNS